MSKEAENLMAAMKELHTLRARVSDLERENEELRKQVAMTDKAWGHDSDGVEMTQPDYACEGKCGRELREYGGMCAGCLEGARLVNRLARKRETERAESAEARVKELEHQVEFIHPWRVRDLETMIQNEHKLYADAHERMLKAEARVKELEDDLVTERGALSYQRSQRVSLESSITDLESQLAAAREAKG